MPASILRMSSDEKDFGFLGSYISKKRHLWTKKIMNFAVDGPTQGRLKLKWKDMVNSCVTYMKNI